MVNEVKQAEKQKEPKERESCLRSYQFDDSRIGIEIRLRKPDGIALEIRYEVAHPFRFLSSVGKIRSAMLANDRLGFYVFCAFRAFLHSVFHDRHGYR